MGVEGEAVGQVIEHKSCRSPHCRVGRGAASKTGGHGGPPGPVPAAPAGDRPGGPRTRGGVVPAAGSVGSVGGTAAGEVFREVALRYPLLDATLRGRVHCDLLVRKIVTLSTILGQYGFDDRNRNRSSWNYCPNIAQISFTSTAASAQEVFQKFWYTRFVLG